MISILILLSIFLSDCKKATDNVSLSQSNGNQNRFFLNKSKKYKLDFYTTHNQFYICDRNTPMNDDYGFWSEEASEDRLAIANGILGVGTECYGPVKGELNILSKSHDDIDFDKYDHIVEAGIKINSGVMEVQDCTSNTVILNIKLKPNIYRVRIYSSNLSSVVGDEGKDYYTVEVWPDKNTNKKVLKRYITK